MKFSFVPLFRRFPLWLALWTGAAHLALGGVLLNKNKSAEIGTLVESETSVSLQSQYGAVEYKKDTLAWYSVDKNIDTLFKAGGKARADGNLQAAMTLFTLSASKEPTTSIQAQQQVDDLRKELVETAASGGSISPVTPTDQTAGLSPEEKIARGKQMIENGETMLDKQHIKGSTSGALNDAAERNIADGKQLVAKGEAELAEAKARDAAEAARKKELEESMHKAKEAIAKIEFVSQWTDEEKKANMIAYGIFAVIILIILWEISMKRAPE